MKRILACIVGAWLLLSGLGAMLRAVIVEISYLLNWFHMESHGDSLAVLISMVITFGIGYVMARAGGSILTKKE